MREPLEGRIWNDDAAPVEQLAELREPKLLKQPLDLAALRFALLAALAVRPLDRGLKRMEHGANLLVGEPDRSEGAAPRSQPRR